VKLNGVFGIESIQEVFLDDYKPGVTNLFETASY